MCKHLLGKNEKKNRKYEQLWCIISKFQALFIEIEHFLSAFLPFLEHSGDFSSAIETHFYNPKTTPLVPFPPF